MMAFLNERSLEEHANWGKAIRLFLRATRDFKEASTQLFKDSAFFEGAQFKQRFNAISTGLPADERALVRALLFKDEPWKCWRQQRVSVKDVDYTCEDPSLTTRDESICEAAERSGQNINMATGMLSAADSHFAGKSRLRLSRAGDNAVFLLHNCDSEETVRGWIAQQRGHFDPAANMAPRDYQTVLEQNPQRFRRTGRLQTVGKSTRRIYEEISTRRQFYVDEGHSGHSAHLEVFDSNGNHLGEADIATGTVDVSKVGNAKRITL